MFENLERATRSDGDRIPEFLRTHPVTRKRISDAYNQTESLTKKSWPIDLEFQLMRARAEALSIKDSSARETNLTSRNASGEILQIANDYLRALVAIKSGDLDQARRLLDPLRNQYPLNIPFQITEVDLYLRAKQPDIAAAYLDEALMISPGNYPLTVKKADIMLALDRPEIASQLLTEIAESRPLDDAIWYQLAEARGLAGDIIGVHQARAEYFFLNGDLERAEKQLSYAQPLARQNFQLSERIRSRLDTFRDLRDELER
jgi:predicted Zn-dependent protease